MSVAFDITLIGDKKLARKMGDLAVVDQRKVMRKAQREAFRVVLNATKTGVPRDTGRLRKGIKLRALKRSRVRSGVYVRTPTREELGIDPGDDTAYYPAYVEFGHDNVPPVPFMRRAFDANKDRVWRKFHVMLWRGVNDIWGRPTL